jgi:hypothetical protein
MRQKLIVPKCFYDARINFISVDIKLSLESSNKTPDYHLVHDSTIKGNPLESLFYNAIIFISFISQVN